MARCGCGTRPPATPSQPSTPPAARTACSGWRSAPMASCWPAPTAMARCGCGTRPPATPSARPSTPPAPLARRARGGVQLRWQAAGQRRRRRHGAAMGSGHRPPWRNPPRHQHRGRRVRGGVQPRSASCWPAPTPTARCGCGTRPPATPSQPFMPLAPALGTACAGWRSAPSASCWPAPAATARCGCGTRPPAAPSARPSTSPAPVRRVRGGVQPRRQAAGQRRRRRHGAAVEPGHRPPAGAPLHATSTGHGVFAVAFSPDGQLLAGAASDGTIPLEEVWLFAHPYKALCADVGRPTAQSWGSYAPGERQPKVCA